VEQNTVYLDTESTHRIMDGTASGSAKGSCFNSIISKYVLTLPYSIRNSFCWCLVS